jgi:hypothetical protein
LVKWQEMRNNLGQEETQLFTPVSAELTTDKIYSSVDISRYQVLKNRPTTIVSEIHSNLISNNAPPPLYHIRCWTWEAPWIYGTSNGQIFKGKIIPKRFKKSLENDSSPTLKWSSGRHFFQTACWWTQNQGENGMERNVQVNTSTDSHEYVQQDIGRVKRFRPSLTQSNECCSPAKPKQKRLEKNLENSKLNLRESSQNMFNWDRTWNMPRVYFHRNSIEVRLHN